jgi:hypothetical protein
VALRKRLSVVLTAAMLVVSMLAVSGPAWAKGGCGIGCEPSGEVTKEQGKNSGWGDGNGGGQNHPKKKDVPPCSTC